MASRYTSGQLVNLMSIDTQRVLEYVKMINLFWICPLQIIISTVMLWSHLGYGSLAGLVVLLLLLPFNGFIGARLRMLQGRLLDFKDRRIKLLNETIMSIRAIKLYAWEEVFQYRIQKIRKQEMANLRQQAFYSTAITFAFNSAPFLVAFASFALYLVLDENNSLDASKMFVSLAIFNIVRRPLAFFPQLITNSLMFMVSLKRISEFLNFTSNEDFIVKGQNLSKDFNNLKNFQQKTKPLIQIDKCTFSWSSCDKMINRFLLKNISISITEPKLYAIIGEVGTGKSSLLSAVLGQMSCVDHESHKFTVNGTIAYVPQNAWIQYGTIRENILFGLNYDYKWYNKVIETCALEKDFSQFQDGDNMIVGQKGFSLSGGQKQRISIARALYSNADIILLDDPLSALDSHIAKHVFNRVIGPTAINSKAYSLTNRSILLLAVYGLFGLGQTIFILVGTLLLNIGCLAASHHLHNQMLARILTAPIWFYDATSSSIGQILNRFSKDIDVADSTLISNFLKLMIELFRTIISFIPIVFGTDLYIMLIIIPLTLLYFAIYKYCISTSRQLIRIESSLRTPIYSFFTETYSGVSVIQAFGIERKFLERSHRNIDMNASAYHMSVTASRWLTIRLDFLGNLVVLSTALFCTFKRNQIDPGMVGLCLSCAYTITGTLNMLVRSFTDLESNIVSVERLIEYTELPQEAVRYVNSGNYSNTLCELNSSKKCSLIGKLLANYVSNMFQTENGFVQQSFTQDYQIRNPNSWLRNGSISICQFSARYRTNLKLCLRHLNVSIENGQKVAIIGRTGAGKSSFALSLFRLIEAENGCIYIGGQNIKDLGLYELRSALTIIPQDSLLFNGTLRENMDPLGQYTDDQIFSALEKVNLTKILKRLTQESNFSSVLEQPLNDSCMQSISAGQKQLFCLARVLLQNPKIVILDEATASIDPATDELVQETIYREFHNCTVLSIVHKLELIVRYPIDKVLVFDNGSIVEYDSPKKLANDSKSYFFRMLNNQI
ncbi:hypothetical protein RDWZM_008598 [Blomia tropicalis]|uniref:Uncharacterized protein n=1 Tax=Blomia tropicalis TaxID=40697 RepID=A0A9Q0M1M8_BLOTA|nr:hypothetical protein RDWZM_008598 [Blomia tropicalis]